jgi:adenine-specific DNA-methyltransferase
VAALDDLLARIQDAALRADLEREIAPLRGDRELGLVFERHLPEKVRLPALTVRRGATVEIRDDIDSPTWQVRKIVKGVAHLARKDDAGQVLTEEHPVDELVVVREFGHPIYPGLRSVGPAAANWGLLLSEPLRARQLVVNYSDTRRASLPPK